jgi:uncharacterized protein (DUF885 family)
MMTSHTSRPAGGGRRRRSLTRLLQAFVTIAWACLGWPHPTIAAAPEARDMNATFTAIADRYVEGLLRYSPAAATQLGDHRYDGKLDDVGAEAREARLAELKGLLTELGNIDAATLSRPNQVDFQLLRQELRKGVWEIERLREWEWNPLVYARIPGDAIYLLVARGTAPLEERLGHVAARCREFPRFFAQARQALVAAQTPHIHAETAVAQTKGILDLIDKAIRPQLAEIAESKRTNVTEALEIARQAVTAQQQWLQTELLPNARGTPRLDAERYGEKFAFDLFSSFSPPELRRLAEREIASLHERMYELSLRIQAAREPGFKPPSSPTAAEKKAIIRRCLDLAAADGPTVGGVVDAARYSLRITTDFVRTKDLLTLPAEPLEIIVMPEFRRGVSVAYCDAPGPLEVGGKTFYAVSPPPADWTAAQVGSFLREYNFRSLHNLTVHEAMPGHYVQLLRSNAVSSKLRAILGSGTFIEGWAVYTERMMVDEGFLPDDLLMRLIVMKWNLRGATNALLDQMIHLDGCDEKTAMTLMMDDAFQEEREAAGKYRRSLLTSVQLSTYFAGYREMVELREAVTRARGDRFTLKSFHDDVLSHGSPPAQFVKALLLEQPIPGTR